MNNMVNNQMEHFQNMNLHGMAMQMNIMGQQFGGMSDTGAPPDSSGSMMQVPIHPMQMY